MALLYKGNKLISVLNKVEILNGLTKVDSLPDNNYDTRGVYEIPYNFDDVYINIKINSTDDLEKEYNVSGLLSKLFRVPITGTKVVDTLPTENIIESPYNDGFYLYYSKADNDIFAYIQTQGWINIGSCDQTFKTLLMSCKGFINTELDDVVLEHGYYAVNTKDYYKYFEHWEEVEYTGDGSDLIDSGYNLPEKNIDKDKVYRIKYFDDVYMILKEGSTGSYLSEELFVMCGIDVCDDFPTKNLVSPSSDNPVYQHFYYIKNKGLYGYSDEAKKFASINEVYGIPFKGELDKNNNNATEMGMYAVYTYKYYRSTTSSTRFKYNNQELNVTPSIEEQTFEATGNDYYSKVIVSPVTSDIDSNLTPENIKIGTTILGIEGKVTTLKGYLDIKKSASSLFSDSNNLDSDTLANIIRYDDTSNVTDTVDMFKDCTSLTTIPELDTSKVTNMGYMFYGCSSLTSIPELDTSKVTSMYYMFYGCSSLTSIPELDTSKVTSMSYMFYGCSSLTSIPELDTSKVTSMYYMFYGCSSLTSIPELDTSKVTNMSYMFYGCSSLTSVPQLDTSSVTNMYYMFYGCSSLTSIPELDTSKVTSMSYMFNGCSSLTSVPQLDTSSVTNMYYMFNRCYLLNKIDITHMNISSTSYSSQFATFCYSLTKLIIRNMTSVPVLNSNAFAYCYHFIGTQNDTYNPDGLKDGRIYVPDDMVDTLKEATNWSTYADIIVGLSTLEEE